MRYSFKKTTSFNKFPLVYNLKEILYVKPIKMKQIKLFAIASVLGLIIVSCGAPKEEPLMPVVSIKDTIKPAPIKDTTAAKDTIVTPPSEDEVQSTSTNNPGN